MVHRANGGLTVSFSESNITYGTQAVYSCNTPGYTLAGVTVRVCGADGEWTGEEPRCECKEAGIINDQHLHHSYL